ncbi:hypothetical protein F8S13_22440 [Chloroflexia bacterium SDU3-3]|nr:hypothetical protein F8S13_22440 [Chloroflexia bacterium SDU3-3]
MTTTKSTRMTEEEVRFLQQLLPHFPECRSEAQLMYQATMLGLWMLAVEAQRPGLVPFGGYTPADLAALLRPRILPALDFLTTHRQLPALFPHGLPPMESNIVEEVVETPAEPPIDPEVASDMEELGTGFMD